MRHVLAFVTAAITTAALTAATAAQDEVWRTDDLDPAVPAPADLIGHEVGARAVRYDTLLAYLKRLADASPLMTMTPYAMSHEGRPLFYVTITSEANHARLGEIKESNARLADPRRLGDADAGALVKEQPGVAWLAYSIHGDELSPCDAAMQVCYLLVAGTDDRTRAWRDELVIHIDPLQNPDGRERYLAQLATLQGKVDNPDYQAMQHAGLWSAGRGNHYLFDLNRDWLMFVQPETRGRADHILSWNPHFLVDSHEMSGLDTYLFDPPREPFNVSLGDDNLEWRRVFSADQARAFDRHGWSYYTGEWYEEWYPGYTNAWGNLLGTISLLYEAPSLNSAAVRQASGELVTYRDAVARNVVGTLANLDTLARNRSDIIGAWHADRVWAVSGDAPMNQTFILGPSDDKTRRHRLLEVLDRHGIEHETIGQPHVAAGVTDMAGVTVDEMIVPVGSTIVRPKQPHRRLASAVLGFDPKMTEAFLVKERTELERERGTKLYDVTAWNLPMAYGLEAWWAESVRAGHGVNEADDEAPADVEPVYGYVIDGADWGIFPALVQLFEAGCVPRVATKPFAVPGGAYDRGAILLRRHENPDHLDEVVAEIATDPFIEVCPVDSALAGDGPDLGGQRFGLLHAPRVAIASQWPVATTSFGATWHVLDDRLGLRCSPVNVQRLGTMDLRKYNVLIIPDSFGASPLRAVLDERTTSALDHWVKAGGTLIAYGNAAAMLADEKSGLSAVRRRRDVLDDLDVYAEAVERERAALGVEVDMEEVWRTGPAPAEAPEEAPETEPETDPETVPDEPAKDAATDDDDARKRHDEWQRRFAPRGVFAAARTDPDHWLCFGSPEVLPLLVSGSSVYLSKPPVQTAVRLESADGLRFAGLLWPEARERVADSGYATRESRGRGQIILFRNDPYMRGYLEGSGRLLLNAVILGPGMGTDQPIPW